MKYIEQLEYKDLKAAFQEVVLNHCIIQSHLNDEAKNDLWRHFINKIKKNASVVDRI